MRKFTVCLLVCGLFVLAVGSAKADHRTRGNSRGCGTYPSRGHIHTYSSGGIYRSYGGYGGYGGYIGPHNVYRSYGGLYNQGIYGNYGYGAGCGNYGPGFGSSGFGLYFRF